MTIRDSTRIIAYSERLAPLTEHEEPLNAFESTELRVVPLWSEDLIAANAGEAEVVIVGSVEPMNAAALSLIGSCYLLVRRGVGLDNIDVGAATALGIPVAYVPDASVEEVSDHALALLLALERHIVRLDRFVQAKLWTRSTEAIASQRRGMRRLSTLTLGIVGLGRIGQTLASKASSVFGSVIGYDPLPATGTSGNLERVTFEELLDQSDLISLHAPLSGETRGMIGSEALGRMRPGALLVNTARGGLIDEAALYEALESGQIAGAGLDVTAEEPIGEESPLLGLETVILTGHSAAAGVAASAEARRLTVSAAVDALEGRRPGSLANPEVLEQANCRLRLNEERQS